MDCNFETKAPNENDLLVKIASHAKEKHNMAPIPQDVMNKVKKAIKK